MELTKNIFFNTDKLVENSKVKISYTGQLFQNASQEVSIHYGFGLNWDNLNDISMKKTELGFQAEIELNSAETFNFCFRNADNIWDNNEGQNYVFAIEKMNTDLLALEFESTYLDTPKKISKAYIWNKKIRIAIYKIISYLPKLISGNYKKKLPSGNQNA